MKFGRQLEKESVPEWSLHNVDYNSLKHEIKVHTTRHQATARTIPGQKDTALNKFENQLFNELCSQHDRVGMFALSKADEIGRRLEYLSDQIQRLIVKCAEDNGGRVPLKRQRRFAKYEREVLRCGEDINALSRFIDAQVTAFRKITKKYQKWTGSTTLGSRFRDTVLSNPKSFTRRDLTQLQSRYDDVLATLRTTAFQFSEPSSPSSIDEPPALRRDVTSDDTEGTHQRERSGGVQFAAADETFSLPPPQHQHPPTHYWNEYDDGSEGGGGDDDGYAIYIDPNDDGFPGVAYVRSVFGARLEKMRRWFGSRGGAARLGGDDQDPERQGLLGGANGDERYPGYGAYGSPSTSGTTTGPPTATEDAYSSSDEWFPSVGYAVRVARGTAGTAPLPSIAEQRAIRYRERVLLYGTVGFFVGAYLLLGAAGLLVATGRHRLRVEVDAGATAGVAASLFCGCCALGMMLCRKDRLGVLHRLAVWAFFAAVCVLNGMLLVVVVGSAA